MSVVQGSTLYGGSVSTASIYKLTQGDGFQFKDYLRTEVRIDGKPRQLTKAVHGADPLTESVPNVRMATDFVTTPTVTINGRQLSLTKLMYLNKMTPADFKDTFPGYQPSGTAIDMTMAPEIQSTVFELAMNAIKTQLNKLHSIGDTGTAGVLRFYDGLTTMVMADSGATQVGTPAVLTSANILSEVAELIQAIPVRLRMNPGLVTFCSVADFDLYNAARAATQTSIPTPDVAAANTLLQSFGNRVKLVPIENFPKNFMFTTIAGTGDDSNLVQGVWVESDSEALKMYKEVETDEDWLILMKFYIGLQYVASEDIFFKNNVAQP